MTKQTHKSHFLSIHSQCIVSSFHGNREVLVFVHSDVVAAASSSCLCGNFNGLAVRFVA